MKVPLVVPVRRDAKHFYASSSLPFVESGSGRYTHRVRSVELILSLVPQWKPHTAVRCWCGMTILLSDKRCHAASRIVSDPSRLLCATCEGRAIGSGQLGAAEISGRKVQFSPRGRFM